MCVKGHCHYMTVDHHRRRHHHHPHHVGHCSLALGLLLGLFLVFVRGPKVDGFVVGGVFVALP